ncbi:hypothetical protein TorRG33x02_355520 [Trema orientale]|uniref:Uncharacterized protein n=1 Tax=Trema orientale TaxID=63057 RepID=A0A2P5A9D8_TREOI|nr:hypothetical protein TorRG33x02_355520 [Trema orientale]
MPSIEWFFKNEIRSLNFSNSWLRRFLNNCQCKAQTLSLQSSYVFNCWLQPRGLGYSIVLVLGSIIAATACLADFLAESTCSSLRISPNSLTGKAATSPTA